MMRRWAAMLTAMVMSALLTACSMPVERASRQDDRLAAAGFHIVPVRTDPLRLQLRTLPPNRVVQQVEDGTVRFVYADPYACGCLLIGDESAWDNYAGARLRRHSIDPERVSAGMYENAPWNWGLSGPGWWAF